MCPSVSRIFNQLFIALPLYKTQARWQINQINHKTLTLGKWTEHSFQALPAWSGPFLQCVFLHICSCHPSLLPASGLRVFSLASLSCLNGTKVQGLFLVQLGLNSVSSLERIFPQCLHLNHSLTALGSSCHSFAVMSDSLRPHELPHARLPCPSLSPRDHSNSCPLSRWCHPTILSSVSPFSSCPQSFPASVFSNELALHIRWPKYWSFSFSISPPNEYSVLISFRIDWFDLLAVQGTLKSLLQHHSLKASILQCSAFFIV